jgi:uncharacterized membrane protein
MTFIKYYLITTLVFLGIDFVWLSATAENLYRKQIGFLMKDNFNFTAAIIFYLFFAGGLLFFVVNKAVADSSWQYALFAGMFFGFITYSTYDMTNYATIKNWPLIITVIDIIWGSFLCGLTSFLSYHIINYFKI